MTYPRPKYMVLLRWRDFMKDKNIDKFHLAVGISIFVPRPIL